MDKIHVFFSPACCLNMVEIPENTPGMVIESVGEMLRRFPLTQIKRILKYLLNNDVSSLENTRVFEEALTSEADAEGLFDENIEKSLSRYGTKLKTIMAWWDAELNKRGVLLHCHPAA